MEALILILLATTLKGGRSDDSVAMDNEVRYKHIYKVHPDPQDLEEADPHPQAQIFQNFAFGKLRDKTEQNQQYVLHTPVENDQTTWRQSNKEVGNNVKSSLHLSSASSSKIEHQDQRPKHTIRIPYMDSTFLEEHKENLPNEQVLGFSSVVEHNASNDNTLESSEETGSLNEIKQVIPKSRVYFKMFYDKNKTKHQSDIPEVLSNNQGQSEIGHQTIMYNYAPLYYEKHKILAKPSNYLTYKSQEKPSVHSNNKFFSKIQSYVHNINQPNQQELPHQPKPNKFQNYFKESSQEQFAAGHAQIATGHQTFKLVVPTSNLNGDTGQQNYQPQPMSITLEQTNRLQGTPEKLPDHFSSPVYVVDSPSSAYNHQNKIYEDSAQTEINKEPSKIQKHNTNFNDLHSKIQYLNFGNEKTKLYNHKNREDQLFKSSGHVQQQQGYYSIQTEKHPSQQVVVSTTIQPQIKFHVQETNDLINLPKVIFTPNLTPFKSDDYIDKYHRDVAQIQNSWKSFHQMKPIKYQSSPNELQLVTKPADSYHFEVNPFIDVGDGGQENFDHQKALEGSTTFNINHAIGNENEVFHKVSNFVTSAPKVQSPVNPADGQPNHFYKQTFLYTFPSLIPPMPMPMPSMPAIGHIFKDSAASNSEFIHRPKVETNDKYVLQPQFISVFPNDYFKLGNSATENDIHQSKLSLHLPKGNIFQELKSEKPEGSLIPAFFKPKHQLKQFRENRSKFNQDQHFQPKKKSQRYASHNRPSQKFSTTVSDDWNLHKTKTRTGSSNKAVMQPETSAHNEDFGRKIIPAKTNKVLNRNREGEGMPKRNGQLNVNLGKDNFRLDVIKEDNHKFSKQGANNEFSVSASYKIDKPFENSNLT